MTKTRTPMLEHRYLLNWILELVLFGRCCKICFHIPPFKFCFKQNSDKYNRMSLKYVWERSEKGLDLGMGGSGLDHSVMLQRMNLQTPQTQYVVFERGVREYHFFSCFCYCHSNYKNITRIAHSYSARKSLEKSTLECGLDCDENSNTKQVRPRRRRGRRRGRSAPER